MNKYTLDLSLQPTTFDLWHASLAAAAVVLAVTLIVVLLSLLWCVSRCRKNAAAPIAQPQEPEVKVVEKIVEVEKVVQAPPPEPVILKEATPDAALQLLSMLQKEARFIDFIKEEITVYSDADIGVAARVVHEGCKKILDEHFKLEPVSTTEEGAKMTLSAGFDAAQYRLTGNVVGQPPFTGTLIHKGWQVTELNLPRVTEGHNARIISAAEVEL